ncbi:hypothetical protein O3Q51_12575 [Cryomorphaceae bacterium 1068]|nr:hypothetical protein [Cryomorphaceae bacterium 1068]
MVDRFLKAKHWQIFLFGVGIPFVLQMILFGLIVGQIANLQNAENPASAFLSSGIIGSYLGIFAISFLSFFILYGWMYSIGVGLKKYLPADVHSRTKFFVFCLVFPIAYIFLFLFLYFQAFTSMIGWESSTPEAAFGGMMGMFFLIIPLHLFAMFCGIYVLRFVAKIIKSVELQRRARFSDYIGYFFLVWFYPIGIWILQPEINKIVSGENADPVSEDGVLDA